MNKKIIRFIKNNWLLILLFNFVAFFGYAFGKSVSVNAYSLNDKGNVVSDNLYDVNLSITSNRSYNQSYARKDNGYVFNSLGGYSYSNYTFLNDLVVGKTYTMVFDLVSEDATHRNLFCLTTEKGNVDSCDVGKISEWGSTPKLTFTATQSNLFLNVYLNFSSSATFSTTINNIMLVEGSILPTSYEPYGTWLSNTNVENLLANSLNISSVSASWSGGSLSDASSYIYNKDGLVWADGVFDYISGEVPSGYSDADVSISFGTRMPTNVNYSYSFIDSIGSSISFYQGNTKIYSINVTDDINNLCSSVPASNLCVINLADKIDVKQYTYFDRVVLWSSNYDHRPLSFGYYSSSFYSGYNKGYSDGYDVGYSNGSSFGYNNGYNRGYDVGFNAGVLHQENNGPNTLVGLVSAIFSGPVTMFQTIFDFNFLGINLSQFFFSLISLLIVVWLIIKFL